MPTAKNRETLTNASVKPEPKKTRKGLFGVLAIVAVVAIAALTSESDAAKGSELSPARYGTYRHSANGYESRIIISDGKTIKTEIRTPMGYADKSGTFSVQDSELSVTWTTFGDTNLGPKPSAPVTQRITIGNGSYGGKEWYFVRLGETEYIKAK